MYGEDAVHEEIGPNRSMDPETAVQAAKDWRVAFPDASGVYTNRFVSGSKGVAEIVWTGTNAGPLNGTPATHRRVEIRAVVVVIEEGGKAKRISHYLDMAGLLQGLGVAPAAMTA